MTPVEPDDHGLEPSAVRGRQVVVRRASMPLSSPATPLQPRSITCPGASTDGERESGAARRDPAATGTPYPTAAGLPGGPRTPGHSPADVTMPHILIILPLKARHLRWAAYAWGRPRPRRATRSTSHARNFFGDYNSRRSDGTRCLKPLGPRLRAAVGPHRQARACACPCAATPMHTDRPARRPWDLALRYRTAYQLRQAGRSRTRSQHRHFTG
jgi:hypothetical protein